MSHKAQISEQLGGRQVDYLDELSEAEIAQLSSAINAAKKHESETLHEAINHALNAAPRLLRGSLRRILFPND